MAAGQLDIDVCDDNDFGSKETGELTTSISEIILVFPVVWPEKSNASNFSSSREFQDQFFISSTVRRLRSSITSSTRRSEVAVNSCGDGWQKKSSMFVWSITSVILLRDSGLLEDGLV